MKRLLLTLVSSLCSAPLVMAASVSQFLPQGSTSDLKDVRVTFAQPVVNFGDAFLPAPFLVECNAPDLAGQGRWLDSRRWLYEFTQAPGPGVSCVASASPDFHDLQNKPLSGKKQFRFDSGGPRLLDYQPSYAEISEDQAFLLQFNAPVDKTSLLENSYCLIEGMGERVPTRLLDPKDLGSIAESSYLSSAKDSFLEALQCQRTLPPGAQVSVVVEAGVKTHIDGLAPVAGTQQSRLDFTVRSPFTAYVTCTREKADAPCTPVTDIGLQFSAQVERAYLKQIRLQAGDLSWTADEFENQATGNAVRFKGPFPEQTALSLILPAGLQDDAGRALQNADFLTQQGVRTAAFPPLLKFAASPFGIVERFGHAGKAGSDQADPPALALSFRRVEPDLLSQQMLISAGQVSNLVTRDDMQVLHWYSRMQRAESGSLQANQIKDLMQVRELTYEQDSPYVDLRSVSLLNQAQGQIAQLALPGLDPKSAQSFEMIGVPLREPGFHVLEIASERLGAALLEHSGPMYVRTSALVTNLGVHIKQGQDDVLAWVTTLDDAQVVPDAQVRIMTCNGQELSSGKTDEQGLFHARVTADSSQYCPDTGLSGLYVTARLDENHPQARGKADFSFALSSWDQGIEPWRFHVPYSWNGRSNEVAHTIFDRSLFSLGETVHMKHYYLEQTRDGFAKPEQWPDTLEISHQGSDKTWTLPLSWQHKGAASVFALNEFVIPKDAPLGHYDVRGIGQEKYLDLGQFQVEEFTLPLLKGKLKLSDRHQQSVLLAPDTVMADIQLEYISGGAAEYLPVSLSALVQPRTPDFAPYSDFTFEPPAAAPSSDPEPAALFLNKKALMLDEQGGLRYELTDLPPVRGPAQYLFELSFMDPNGKIQTLSQTVPVWPAQVQAGLRSAHWMQTGQKEEIVALALDAAGQVQVDVPMRIDAVKRTTHSTRKRLVGGFYSYDSVETQESLGTLCEGRSDQQGRFHCTHAFDDGGEIELRAIARDSQGHESVAATQVWVSSEDQNWFAGGNDDRIDLIPEKKIWAPGETARIQVRMPYREATALISVEREGVLHTQVQKLAGDFPVAEINILPEWGPNVYVSALVIRGRLRDVPWYSFFTWGWKQPSRWYQAYQQGGAEYIAPTQFVDLSKPSFRFGLVGIQVSSQADALKVEVSADKPRYGVREQAQVVIQVKDADGRPAAHANIAFAAVDQALLELSANSSWNLLEAMRAIRPYGVNTATAQSEIVGRRHYGRKALPTGGGGGKSPTRELLDTLLLWQGNIELDEQGKAVVQVPLNDALSRFVFVAIAEQDGQRFGSGSTEVTTGQDVQLISGLPEVVREGDRYQAQFTVRNSSDRDMELELSARYDGEGVAPGSLSSKAVQVSAGKAAQLSWEIQAPGFTGAAPSISINWQIDARELRAEGKPATDSLAQQQRLYPVTPVTAQQAALLPLSPTQAISLPVQAPATALRTAQGQIRGGIELRLLSSLAGGLQGVHDWFEQYPYTCLEQQASRFMGMDDTTRWRELMARLASYQDESGLLRYFPSPSLRGSVALTAYILMISDEARQAGLEFNIPDQAQQKMLNGLQAYVQGRGTSPSWQGPEQRLQRRILALQSLARYGRASGAMLESIRPDVQNWPTATVLDWLVILQHVPMTADLAQQREQADRVLQARLHSRGTSLSLGDDPINQDAGLMVSRTSNQARLILQKAQDRAWRQEMPHLLNGLLAQQKQGAWRMTTENLLGALAVRRFAQTQEERPEGLSIVAMGDEQASVIDWSTLPEHDGIQQTQLSLPWPAQQQQVNIDLNGAGSAWAELRALAAVPVTEAVTAGFSIERQISAIDQAVAGVWSRGDSYKVSLRIRALAPVNWAVVSDPVPAGATILGSGLGRDSRITAAQADEQNSWPSFVERKFDVYRAYFEQLPQGETRLEYVVRLNTVGQFALPPTRIEALYEPDVYGVWPNVDLMVVQHAPEP